MITNVKEKILASRKKNKTYELTLFILTYKRFDYLNQLIAKIDKIIKCNNNNILIHISDNDCNNVEDKIDFCHHHMTDVHFDYVYTYNINSNDFVSNINHCFEICETKYISFCHDDDFLSLQFFDKIEKVTKIMKKKGIAYMMPRFKVFSDEELEHGICEKAYKIGRFRRYSLKDMYYTRGNCFLAITCGAIVNRELAISLGGLNEEMEPAADFDFVVRILKSNNMVYQTPFFTGFYRMGNNASSVKSIMYSARKIDLKILNDNRNSSIIGKILMKYFLYEIVFDYSIRFGLNYLDILNNSNIKNKKYSKFKFHLLKYGCKLYKVLTGLRTIK